MAEKVHAVNLIADRTNAVLNQFFTWALSIGRLLVILTEALALGVFLYRFTLDMQIVDLHDKIKQQTAIIQSFKKSEDEFRNLHARLAYARYFNQHADTALVILKDLLALGENKVTFRNLVVTKSTIEIEAQAPNSGNLSRFVESVKNYAKVTSLSIDKVENKTSSALIIVRISGGLQQDETATFSAQTTSSTQVSP